MEPWQDQARLYQHVHLDHGAASVRRPTLERLETAHLEAHDQGVFRFCEPHRVDNLRPSVKVARLNDHARRAERSYHPRESSTTRR